jgi:hypothetical protein
MNFFALTAFAFRSLKPGQAKGRTVGRHEGIMASFPPTREVTAGVKGEAGSKGE